MPRAVSSMGALLSTPALLAARGIGVTVTVRLARLFCVPPPPPFSRKRERDRSQSNRMQKAKLMRIITFNYSTLK